MYDFIVMGMEIDGPILMKMYGSGRNATLQNLLMIGLSMSMQNLSYKNEY